MGIDPQLWGPSGWRFIHYVCLGAPEHLSPSEQKTYYNFLHSIQSVLPCGACRKHFQENLQKHPLTDKVLATQKSLFEWSVAMHNEVNAAHNKPLLTPEEALHSLFTLPPQEDAGKKKLYLILILILTLVAVTAIYIAFRGKQRNPPK